jgi:ketosteroid isomerase-like protein
MTLDYAGGGELLERYGRAWETFDGDAWVDLFTEDAEYHEDPFEPPLVGHNALRAYLLDASRSQAQVTFEVERHWVSGPTVLASWRAGFIRQPSLERVRLAGFMTLELASDDRVVRFREWTSRRTATTDAAANGAG